jgi:uncharacterized protein
MAGTPGDEIKLFVETVVKEIVDIPENVRVSVLESETIVVVELTTDRSDTGLVIGREGRMARALRVLITAVATKLGKKSVLQILEHK